MALNITKGNTRIPFIPGTKPSIKNAQLLVSTGIPSLDHIVGGGLPIGSILMIEEDTYGTYAKVMLKYFMAEGVVTDQPLLIGSQDVEPTQLLSEMPSVITESSVHAHLQSSEQLMKIAWRYQNMKVVDTSPSGGQIFGHFYDLTKPMDPAVIEKANVTEWHDESWHAKSSLFENSAYADLLMTVQKTLKNGQYSISETPAKRQLLRIALHSLGSRLWLPDSEETSHRDLVKFLYYFRTLLRNSYAIGLITVPVDNFENSDAVVGKLEHLSDVAIKLESFAGSKKKETNPLFRDYHGLLYVKKLHALNTLAPYSPESRDLVFKLRRKKFVIEVLHLPPELDDTTEREQDETPQTGGCGSHPRKSLLDF